MKRRPQKPAYLLTIELRAAKQARHDHTVDCPRWDYENTHCEECDQHNEAVAHLRKRLAQARAWESGATVAPGRQA